MIIHRRAAASSPARTPFRLVERLAVAAAVATLSLIVATTGGPASAARVRVITYPGVGHDVRLTAPDGLGATSPSFRRFVHRELIRIWGQSGNKPSCKPAALVTVKRWRSDGFAYIANEGLFGRCANGGVHQVVVRRHGTWVAPGRLGGQDDPYCSTLRAYGVPRGIGQPTCYTDDGRHEIRYPGPR